MDNLMTLYNATDAAVTEQVRRAFWHELDDGFGPAYNMTLRLFEPLTYIMTHGIRVDLSDMEVTKVKLKEKEVALQAELNKLCGRPLNANSPKDCAAYFYIEKGIPPYLSRPKPGEQAHITTDDMALTRLARGTKTRLGLHEAKLVQQLRGITKLYGTYLDINFDSDGRLRCSYNPRGTKFGRLSSSSTIFETGTNLQNLPPEFKRFLVPDPRYFLWEVDKRQAEWVVVAYLTNDAAMLRVILDGRDPHTSTASLMFRIPEDIIRLDSKLVGYSTDPQYLDEVRSGDERLAQYSKWLPRTMSGRQAGKKSNHGLNYDEGYTTFGLTNEIPEHEAKRMVDLYHQIYPGIRHWYEYIKRQLAKDRSLTNCFGRKVHFMGAWGDDLWKSAYSMLPQSTVVDSLNKGLCDIYYDPDPLFDRLAIMAQVHDSLMGQAHESTLHDGTFYHAMQKVYDYISPELQYSGKSFKIATDMKVGMNWATQSEDNPKGMVEVKLGNNQEEFISKLRETLHVGQGAT